MNLERKMKSTNSAECTGRDRNDGNFKIIQEDNLFSSL